MCNTFFIILLLLYHILAKKSTLPLLLYLLIRPTLDIFRDAALISFHEVSINLNAGIAVLFALWSAATLVKERHMIPKHAPTMLLLLLTAVACASVFWSVAPVMTMLESLKLFNAAAMFLLAFLFVKKGDLTRRDLAATIAASAAIPIALGFFQLASGGGIATGDLRGRIHGTLAHPNVFAFLLVSVMILAYEYREKFSTRVTVAIFALLTTLLLFTYTRAGFIGAALFFFAVGLVRAPKLVIKILAGLFLFLAVAIPVNRVLVDQLDTNVARQPIVERLAARHDDADSFQWRLSLLRETLPIVHKRPLFGYGFGAFADVWEDNRGAQHLFDDSAEAHNDYLRLLLELGLTGLALYVGLLLSLMVYARKNLTLFVWILMFAIVSLSENMLHHTPIISLTFAWWGAALASGEKKITARVFPPLENGAGYRMSLSAERNSSAV